MLKLFSYLNRIFSKEEEADTKPKYVSVWSAKVLVVFGKKMIRINKGRIDNDKTDSLINIKLHQRVLIYNPDGPELHDCQTGESYGKLEVVKGTGRIAWVMKETSLVLLDKNTDNKPAPEVNDLVKPI